MTTTEIINELNQEFKRLGIDTDWDSSSGLIADEPQFDYELEYDVVVKDDHASSEMSLPEALEALEKLRALPVKPNIQEEEKLFLEEVWAIFP